MSGTLRVGLHVACLCLLVGACSSQRRTPCAGGDCTADRGAPCVQDGAPDCAAGPEAGGAGEEGGTPVTEAAEGSGTPDEASGPAAAVCTSGTCGRTGHPPGFEIIEAFLDDGDLPSADLILKDIWPVPRYAPVELDAPLTWREAPYRDKYWLFLFYSLRPTSHLLWAFRQTGDTRYRDKLMEVLTSFAERGQDSPYSRDKHASAFRAMVLVNTYWKLRMAQALAPQEERTLAELIHATGRFLEDPAHFDDDYNHGITEAIALLLVAENFPEWPESPGWQQLAHQRLQLLFDEAVDEDGVANEKSPYYHFYILGQLWELSTWTQRHPVAQVARLQGLVRKMLRYGTHIVQPDGTLPMLGVSQGRNMRKPDPNLLTLLQQMGQADPAFGYSLWGGTLGVEPAERSVLFRSSGHAVLRSAFGPPETFAAQTHVTFNVGPYRTTHSHLDALGLTLYSAGRVLLTDSGYYTARPGEWFDYFHGTMGHNTVVVDESSQQPGVTTPGELRAAGDGAYQSGWHQLYAGVTHRRGVLLLARDLVLVWDALDADAPRTFDQAWHLPPDLRLVLEGTRASAVDAAGNTLLTVLQGREEGLRAFTRRGSNSPLDGWYSEDEHVKLPADVVRFRKQGTAARFLTLLASGPLATQVTLAAGGTDESPVADVCAAGTRYHVSLQAPGTPAEAFQVDVTPQGCGGP